MRKLIAPLGVAVFLLAGASALAQQQASSCTSATESCAARQLTDYLRVHPQYPGARPSSAFCHRVSPKHFACTWLGGGLSGRGGPASVIRRGSAWKIAVGPPTCVEAGSLQCLVELSQSMEPTLGLDDLISVDLYAYQSADPAAGDIVLFHPPAGIASGTECGVAHPPRQVCPQPTPHPANDELVVKRVVAGPGDTLSISDGHPVLNGVENSDEPYTNPCGGYPACTLPKPIVIPPGDYFVMGDNRGSSDDSRFWGPIRKAWIVGKVVSY